MRGLEESLREGLRAFVARFHLLVPALLVALPPLAWVRAGTYRASLTTLGRDQGIFQYIAWAVTQGDVDYRDVRDVNGPLTHLVHMLFLALGGRDEHRFRVLDLATTGLTFAIVGACLPGVARAALGGKARPETTWAERAAWAFAAWVALSAQYLMYLYWDLAQRENFCDWFLLPSLGLQLVAQGRMRDGRSGRALLTVAGLLSVIPWFGKPTFVIFTTSQVLCLALDREVRMRVWRRLALFAAGGAVAAGAMLAFLLAYGDARAFLHISLVDVPAMYRFLMPRLPTEILALSWGGVRSALAAVTSLVMVALILDNQLPRRALAIALAPMCGLAGVIAQGKGFPYHFHPVSAGLTLQWLLLVVWASERFGAQRGLVARLLPFAAAAALAMRVSALLATSPHVTAVWLLDRGATAERRESRAYVDAFKDSDFFPWEMRQTAAYLKEHTSPTDRVQLYGMDPYVLFLAERRSATPYIYAYDLNADAAIAGSWTTEGLHPTAAQADHIRSLRDEHETDLLERLEKRAPAAFVFIDKAPLLTWEDAYYDFKMHNPRAGAWVETRYTETASFGEDRVFLRNDLVTDAPEMPKTPAQ